jgi:hypothetical protein
MKYLYAVKGCSHCDSRGTCSDKNSEATLLAAVKRFEQRESGGQIWEAACKGFTRKDSEEVIDDRTTVES